MNEMHINLRAVPQIKEILKQIKDEYRLEDRRNRLNRMKGQNK